jgi:hypothetical protein
MVKWISSQGCVNALASLTNLIPVKEEIVMAGREFTQEEWKSEEWRSVDGYEGIYEVSDLGRLRRAYRGPKTQGRHRLIRAYPNRNGYFFFRLSRKGTVTRRAAHSMVMLAFVGPRPDGLQVNHVDGDKGNNRLRNLEYVTRQENMRHAVRLGLIERGLQSSAIRRPECILRGESLPFSKLTDAQVREIKYRHAYEGVSQMELGRQYGVAANTINAIVNGRTWAHVRIEDGPWG